MVFLVPLSSHGTDDLRERMHQFKQSIRTMYNSLVDLLHSQQQMQNDTTDILATIHQAQLEHAIIP